MTKIKLAVMIVPGIMLCALFQACNGLFGHVYDEPEQNLSNEFGFVEVDEVRHTGTIYVHTEDYKRWVYVSFSACRIDSTEIVDESGDEIPLNEEGKFPSEWDVAIHRYDAKTNGGAVLETSMTSMDEVGSLTEIPQGDYVADLQQTTDRIVIDMSGMMEGKLTYAKSDYNPVLSKWLNVDTSQMPPLYTLSEKVYIVRLKNGLHAALQLTDFKNAKNVKGYMTVKYAYPLESCVPSH